MANDDNDQYGANWREAMRSALREGKATTMITFNGTKYLITMQPLEGIPAAAPAATTPVPTAGIAWCVRFGHTWVRDPSERTVTCAECGSFYNI